MRCLEEGLNSALVVMALPPKYRPRLRSINMLERLNREIRRRERVIQIFPNEESALRLIGALLCDQHETWSERKYFDMADYNQWREETEAKRAQSKVTLLRPI